MDAVWASVVVVLAFMGTFIAIDSSVKTATTDVRKTAAYDVAQNELDRLRKTGDKNLPDLLALNNTATPPASPSRTVVLDDIPYSIWTRAYYVDNIAGGEIDACGGSGSVDIEGAKYVFIKATVTWPGMRAGQEAVIDTYYSPEGGDLQTNTATLRLFLQNELGVALPGLTVSLYRLSTSTSTDATTSATGCALWTALPAGNFEIRVDTGTNPATAKRDIYMTFNPVTVPVRVPSRGAITRTLKIAVPLTVVPAFISRFAAAGPDTAVATDATTSDLVGPWVAASTQIARVSGTDFTLTGTDGVTMMPHSDSAIANRMFPDAGGYTTWAGPCDVNDPGTASRVTIPDSSANVTWVPGGAYAPAPVLRVPSLRAQITSPDALPNTGEVQVRLTNRVGGGATTAACAQYLSLYNTWIKLPGRVPGASGFLPDSSYALPVGRYDICVRQKGNNARGWGTSTSNHTRYMLRTGVDNVSPGPTTQTFDVRGMGTNNPALCGDTGLWTA